MVDIKPLDELELWSRPGAGQLPRWVRAVILLGCAVTVLVVGATAYVLWKMDSRHFFKVDAMLAKNGPPFVVLALLLAAFLPRSGVSRFVRMAIVLPLVHVLIMLVAWQLIPALQLPTLGERTPMSRDLPVLPMTLLVVGATVIAGALIARKRRDRIHAIVMLALANLLLFGMWLPIASRLIAGAGRTASWEAANAALHAPATFAAAILLPPFGVAMIYTALAINRPALAHRLRTPIAVLVFALVVTAMVVRTSTFHGAYLLYDNGVHLLVGIVMVAVVATSGLAIASWRASRRAPVRLARERDTRTGTIADEDIPVVAFLQITSWLRGPRLVTRPFTMIGPAGEVVVPGNVEVAAPIPRVSTVLRAGEAVVVLRQGDHIEVAGFAPRTTADSPFRGTQAILPGSEGIVVGRSGDTDVASHAVGLTAWRPSVAYLMIVIAVALPGLLGLFAPTWK